jgi:flagellar motor protein MotB
MKKPLIIVCIWLLALGIVYLGKVSWYDPKQVAAEKAAVEAKEQAEADARQQLLSSTSATARYKHQITLALDSFSGYAVFRSEEFKNQCASRGIKVAITDDAANYETRLANIQSGQTEMAVFPIDALIKTSAKIGDLPATIVALVDETKGADGAVAYTKAFPNIDAMNDPNTKFVVTADSPSETLVRVLMSHFNLDRLSPDPWVKVGGAGEVVAHYQRSKPTDKLVYVLWEPYVSQLTVNPECRVIIDSSKFKGYIVDSLVVSRDYLLKNNQVVKDVVEAYLTASYQERGRINDLVFADSQASGSPLDPAQVKKVAEGIWWKNTQENYGHFGFSNGSGLQHIEDMIQNITSVLVKTGAIKQDPTHGTPNMLYYDKILNGLYTNNFHPGFGGEKVREEKSLGVLTDEQWAALTPVGTLHVPNLVFARGTTKLTSASEAALADLTLRLSTWPQYYLVVQGNASQGGDPEANKRLAQARAAAAVDRLVENGVDRNRLKAVASNPQGGSTVSFVLGQVPY